MTVGRRRRVPVSRRSCTLALVLLAGCGSGESVSSDGCAAALAATLTEWNATHEILPAPPPPGFADRVRIATHEIGVWILDDTRADGSHDLTRVGPNGFVRVSFAANCARVESAPSTIDGVRAAAQDAGDRFTDADLRSALAFEGGTVIYVWSPHMPLSVDGYAELSEAAAPLGMQVIPVLFADGDRTFAETEARRGGIPAEGLRETASIELFMRDAQVHAPAILVFHAGEVSPVLPGYRNADGYRAFLEAVRSDPQSASSASQSSTLDATPAAEGPADAV
jgi:hypothetical protein